MAHAPKATIQIFEGSEYSTFEKKIFEKGFKRLPKKQGGIT
jgi:hypothetical protein